MSILSGIWRFLDHLQSFSRYERERKSDEEKAGYHFVHVMRARDNEFALLIQKRRELREAISSGKVDAQSGSALMQDMELKEKLLNSKVLEIEKTKYNAWILEGFEKEKAEKLAIEKAWTDIERLESEGSATSEELNAFKKELLEKERLMKVASEKVSGLPVDHLLP